jgi:hypothetical protein
MIIASYFFSMAFLAYVGILFNTSNAINVFCKVISLLMAIAGISAGMSIIETGEIHQVSYVAMGWSALMGGIFLFAKGESFFAIITKMACFLSVVSAVIFFSV